MLDYIVMQMRKIDREKGYNIVCALVTEQSWFEPWFKVQGSFISHYLHKVNIGRKL